MPQMVALAKIGDTTVMLQSEDIHAVQGEQGYGERGTMKAIYADDISQAQMRDQGTKQCLFTAAFPLRGTARLAQYRPS